VECFTRYLAYEGRGVTRADFEAILAEKLGDALFLRDVPALLAADQVFDAPAAAGPVRELLLARLPA
jgi:hypothetical protein